MAYSNTNRDKEQVQGAENIKKAVFVVVLLVVCLSSIFNIYNKWFTLSEARDRNNKMTESLNKLLSENKQMGKQIEEASGSAYVERKAREYLGVGTTNDSWLILPNVEPNLKVTRDVKIVEERQNILKWWDLFTK